MARKKVPATITQALTTAYLGAAIEVRRPGNVHIVISTSVNFTVKLKSKNGDELEYLVLADAAFERDLGLTYPSQFINIKAASGTPDASIHFSG